MDSSAGASSTNTTRAADETLAANQHPYSGQHTPAPVLEGSRQIPRVGHEGPHQDRPRPAAPTPNVASSTSMSPSPAPSRTSGQMRPDDDFSDCSIICRGIRFKVHRLVLTANSAYMRKALTGGTAEQEGATISQQQPQAVQQGGNTRSTCARGSCVVLNDYEPALVRKLLLFMYNGRIQHGSRMEEEQFKKMATALEVFTYQGACKKNAPDPARTTVKEPAANIVQTPANKPLVGPNLTQTGRRNSEEPRHTPGPSTSSHVSPVGRAANNNSVSKINNITMNIAAASSSSGSRAGAASFRSSAGAQGRDKRPGAVANGEIMIGNIQVVPTARKRQPPQLKCDSHHRGRNCDGQQAELKMIGPAAQSGKRLKLDNERGNWGLRAQQGISTEVTGRTLNPGEDTRRSQFGMATVLWRVPDELCVRNLPTQSYIPASRRSVV